MKKDIENIEDIRLMVNTFYQNIREDDLLGPIFEERIAGRWPAHLEKMYRFWETVLLNEHSYSGSPFAPHAAMDLQEEHYKRWVNIFHTNADNLFEGPVNEEAKSRAVLMATIFFTKSEYIRNVSQ